jgi:primary-amine oxidase
VFGVHHVTGPEERPVTAADRMSFWLRPFGFFDCKPTLDADPLNRRR